MKKKKIRKKKWIYKDKYNEEINNLNTRDKKKLATKN